MERVHRAGAVDRQELVDPVGDRLHGLDDLGRVVGDGVELVLGQVVADRDREDEVAVGQTLHQCGRTEAVRAVVGEVRLAGHVEARDGRLQVVVDPEATHRVVHGGKIRIGTS